MILFYAIALAIIYLVTESWIMRPLRILVGMQCSMAARVLIYCPACFGFWTGLAMGWWYPLEMHGALRLVVAALTTMLAGAVWSKWFAQSPYALEVSIIEEETLAHDPSQTTEETTTEGH